MAVEVGYEVLHWHSAPLAEAWVLQTALTFVVCHCVMIIFTTFTERRQFYKRLSIADQYDWNQRLNAFLHATALTVGGVVSASDLPLWNDPHWNTSLSVDTFGAISLGYVLYDTAYMVYYWKHVGHPGFLVHHGFMIVGLLCVLVFRVFSIWGSLFMALAEGSNIHMNGLWLLQKAGLETTTFFKINGVIFFLAFTIFRIVGYPYYIYYSFQDISAQHHLIGTSKGHLDFAAIYFCITTVIVIALLSFFWYHLIILEMRNALFPPTRKSDHRKKDD